MSVRHFVAVLIIAHYLCVLQTDAEELNTSEVNDSGISDKISRGILQLANNIGAQLHYGPEVKTQVFSPLSIFGALSLLMLGSSGTTFNQLTTLLGLDTDVSVSSTAVFHSEFGQLLDELVNNKIKRRLSPWKYIQLPIELRTSPIKRTNVSGAYHTVSIANGVFTENTLNLNPDYKEAVETIYRSEVTPLCFATESEESRNYINCWVNEKTNGKIKSVLGSNVRSDIKMIIVSTLYFKAIWEKPFIEGGTVLRNFFPNGEMYKPIQTQMMANGGVFPFYSSEKYDCRILGLPYEKNTSTMYIILPNNSTREKLITLQRDLTADGIEEMISQMEMKTAVMIFPKMHIENSINMKDILTSLGLQSLFQQGSSDLSLVSQNMDNSTSSNFGNVCPQSCGQEQKVVSNDRYVFDSLETENLNPKRYQMQATMYNQTRNLSSRKLTQVRGHSAFKDEQFRVKRQMLAAEMTPSVESLHNLDHMRNDFNLRNPGLFADNIIHKLDLTVTEKGTEGGAATITYLMRSGTDVIFRVDTPFMFLIRHEATKLPIFYGSVFEPEYA